MGLQSLKSKRKGEVCVAIFNSDGHTHHTKAKKKKKKKEEKDE